LFCNELQSRVVELIDNAEHSVILSTFLLADENVETAILKAAKRKVRVYILLACETRLDGDVPDDDFGKKCLVQHKEMLNKLSGYVHFASAPHFHAKAVVIDAFHETGNAKGLLLTANLTEEALKRNEELGVSLSRHQIDEIVKVFRWAIFESAQHHMTSRGEFSAYKSPGNVGYPRELTEILVTSSEDAQIKEHALALINKADKELIISSFGWQEDHQLVKAICERAKSGVSYHSIRQRPAAMAALLAMKQAGASVKCFKWLHAKQL
jgi:phosphatidylserine/phosphatidylglycerophosphate/cardiolipin synthase-like enzyme